MQNVPVPHTHTQKTVEKQVNFTEDKLGFMVSYGMQFCECVFYSYIVIDKSEVSPLREPSASGEVVEKSSMCHISSGRSVLAPWWSWIMFRSPGDGPSDGDSLPSSSVCSLVLIQLLMY